MQAELDPRRVASTWASVDKGAARVSGGATRYAHADVASRWPEGCGKSLEDDGGKLWGSLIVGAVLSSLWTRERNGVLPSAAHHIHVEAHAGEIVRSTDSPRLLALWARQQRTAERFELA